MEIINPISILPLVGGFFVLLLGLFVFFKNPKLKLNIIFALLSITVFVWLFGTFMMFNSQSDEQAIFWDRFIYAGVVFVPALMYNFSLIFTERKVPKKTLIFAYLLSFVFLALSRTEHFVEGLFYYEWGVHTRAQFFHHIFLVAFCYFLLLTLINFYKYYRKKDLTNLERARAKYVFLAFFILISVGTTAYFPAYGIGIYPFSYLSGIIFTIILAYAIIKYRLMDIRLALSRGVVHLLSFSSVILLGFSAVLATEIVFPGVSQNVLIILAIVVGVFLFRPIFDFFQDVASRYFHYTF